MKHGAAVLAGFLALATTPALAQLVGPAPAGEPKAAPSSAPASVPPSAYVRGLAALDRGDFDAAIAEFTAAMANDPTDTFAYIKRATAYEKKGDSASAIADYRKALKLVDGDSRGEINAKIRKLEKTPK
jgi:Tfp pilus assembly protein PilF